MKRVRYNTTINIQMTMLTPKSTRVCILEFFHSFSLLGIFVGYQKAGGHVLHHQNLGRYCVDVEKPACEEAAT